MFLIILVTQEACDTVWEHRQSDEYASVREQLYGLYKVATEGKCEEPKPEQTVRGISRRR